MGGKRKSRGSTMLDFITKRNTKSAGTSVVGDTQMASQQPPLEGNPSQDDVQPQPRPQLQIQPLPPPPPPPQPSPPVAPQIGQPPQLENLQQGSNSIDNATTNSGPSMSSSSVGFRKGRGAARPCIRWGTTRKLEVFLGANDKIAGPDKRKLQSTLGVLPRNGSKVPLTYPSFSEIPTSITDDLWEEVQDNTTLGPEAKPRVLADVALKWQDFKSHLKAKYFVPHLASDSIPLKSPDNRVSDDQWTTLVAYWRDQAVMEIAERNKKNRALVRYPHRTGRIDFDEVIEMMRASNLDTTRLDIFLMTRMPKAGKTLDGDIQAMFDTIKEHLSKVPDSEQTTTFKEQLLSNLVGGERRGSMRCLGAAVPPVAAPSSSTSAPFALDSIPEGLLELLVEKVGDRMLQKARDEAREEVAVALQNFFQSIVGEANHDPNKSSVRGEDNDSAQVPDASSVHKPQEDSHSLGNLP